VFARFGRGWQLQVAAFRTGATSFQLVEFGLDVKQPEFATRVSRDFFARMMALGSVKAFLILNDLDFLS
jgi:hypothetical protein